MLHVVTQTSTNISVLQTALWFVIHAHWKWVQEIFKLLPSLILLLYNAKQKWTKETFECLPQSTSDVWWPECHNFGCLNQHFMNLKVVWFIVMFFCDAGCVHKTNVATLWNYLHGYMVYNLVALAIVSPWCCFWQKNEFDKNVTFNSLPIYLSVLQLYRIRNFQEATVWDD